MRKEGYELVLKENERLDDLECGGLLIVQRRDKYCFNLDSVMLANLVDEPKGKTVADLGSGSGVISILLSGKRGAAKVYAVELQEFMLELLRKNVALNALEDSIEIVSGRMQNAYETIGKHLCDIVVSNPPYSKLCSGLESKDPETAVCRHEIEVNLDEVVQACADLVKPKGSVYLIYKAPRLGELFNALHRRDMAVKKLYLISPAPDIPIDTVIVKAVKGAKEGVQMEHIFVYDEARRLTDRVAALYGKTTDTNR